MIKLTGSIISICVHLIFLATPNPLSLPGLTGQSSIYFPKNISFFCPILKTWIPAFAGMTVSFHTCQKMWADTSIHILAIYSHVQKIIPHLTHSHTSSGFYWKSEIDNPCARTFPVIIK
jgi:hypothetical protein